MKQLRYFILYIRKFSARYKKTILVSVLATSLLGVALYLLITRVEIKPTLSEGIVGTYTESNLPTAVGRLLSRSLITLDSSGSAKPELVKQWESSDSAKLYKFTLRDQLTWSDGKPVKSSDLAIPIGEVEITNPDDQTIQFKLADSFSPFPTLLTKPILKKDSLLGVGPYRVANISKDRDVFIKKLSLVSDDPTLPNLIIRFYPTEKIAKNALKIGEVQSLLGINEIEDLVTDKPFAFSNQTNYSRLVTIFYNTQDPILSDQNFRLALSYSAPAIPNETEAKTSLSPLSWAFNGTVKDYLNNAEAAKASLDKVKNGKDSTITLTSTTTLQSIGEQVVEAWNKAGIKAVLRVEEGIPQNFQALLISQNIPSDPDQYSLWHKLGQTNISKYSHPRLDKDLEDGRKLEDMEQRKLRYIDFQKLLSDQSPATFLYFPKYNVIYLKKVELELKKVLDLQLEKQ